MDLLGLLFAFVLVDLLFLPQITQPFLIPSSILISAAVAFKFKFRLQRIVVFLVLFVCVFFSFINGLDEQKVLGQHSDDFKRLFQFFSWINMGR